MHIEQRNCCVLKAGWAPRVVGAVIMLMGLAGAVNAGPVLWVDDANGQIGTVDVATGHATVIGNSGVILTDIAFDPNGNLFGTSFTSLYHINKLTGAATFIGNNGVNSMNALVFGSDGTLYGTASNTTDLYKIDPASGAATSLGNIGFKSAGDLAFHNGVLYESSSNDELLKINLAVPTATDIGSFGFSSVFGLANGDDGVLYGVAGTFVFSVNTTTGHGTEVANYGGTSLGAANGSAFFAEAIDHSPVPEPSSLLLLAVGSAAVTAATWWQRRRTASPDSA